MSDILAKAELLAIDTFVLASEDDISISADKLIANFESLFPGFTDLERGTVMLAAAPILKELTAIKRLTLHDISIIYATAITGVLNARFVSRQQGY